MTQNKIQTSKKGKYIKITQKGYKTYTRGWKTNEAESPRFITSSLKGESNANKNSSGTAAPTIARKTIVQRVPFSPLPKIVINSAQLNSLINDTE